MLFLIPLVLFPICAAALTWLSRRGARMAYLWLLPAFIISMSWLLLLLLPIQTIQEPLQLNWLKMPELTLVMKFATDSITWPYLFFMLTWLLVYFLTLTVRLESEGKIWLWVDWLLVASAGILAFSSINLPALILTWTIVDVVSILVATYHPKPSEKRDFDLSGTFPRLLSLLGLLVALLVNPDKLGPINMLTLAPTAAVVLFFTAFLRAGLFSPPTDDQVEGSPSPPLIHQGVHVLMAFALLSRLPREIFTPIAIPLVSTALLLVASWRLITGWFEKNMMSSISAAVICLAGISAAGGNALAVIGWAGVWVVMAGFHHFYSLRITRMPVSPWLVVLALAGFPLTNAGLALQNFFLPTINTWGVIIILIWGVILFRIWQNGQEIKKSDSVVEPIYLAVYLIGLLILIFSSVVIAVKDSEVSSINLNLWWIGAAAFGMTVVGAFFWWRKISLIKPSTQLSLRERFARLKVVNILSTTKRMSDIIFIILRETTRFFTQLLEGQGGVIWSLVILALFISLIGGDS